MRTGGPARHPTVVRQSAKDEPRAMRRESQAARNVLISRSRPASDYRFDHDQDPAPYPRAIGTVTRRMSPEPSALAMKNLPWSPPKMIFVPSGDHAGLPVPIDGWMSSWCEMPW